MSVEQHEQDESINNDVNENEQNIEPKEIDVNALMERVERLENTNQRLLDESKSYKQKWQGLRTEVEKENVERLTEKENWKELLEIEKNRSFEMQEQLKSYKKQSLQQKIQFEVAKHANNAFDVNDVIKSLPKEMISIDEDTLEINGVKDAVEYVKANKPYFFNSKKSTGMVSNKPQVDSGKKTYDDLSKQEKDALFLDALNNL